jgi:hypothetical protein
MSYCTQADVNAVLPPGSLANPGRLLESVDVTSGLLRLGDHGFVLNDEVSFRAEGCSSLPNPLDPDATYFVVPSGPHAFRLKTDANATVEVQLYDEAGGDTLVIASIPWARALDWGAAMVDSYLPAHVLPPPGPPYHVRLVHWNAELTAHFLLNFCGSSSAALNATLVDARKDLESYGKGKPLRGPNAPESTNLAASASASRRDNRWRQWGLL